MHEIPEICTKGTIQLSHNELTMNPWTKQYNATLELLGHTGREFGWKQQIHQM